MPARRNAITLPMTMPAMTPAPILSLFASGMIDGVGSDRVGEDCAADDDEGRFDVGRSSGPPLLVVILSTTDAVKPVAFAQP